MQRARQLEQLACDAVYINPEISGSAEYKTFKLNNYSKNQVPECEKYKCIRCGAVRKHFAQDCPAINVSCHKCHKRGHLSKV